MLPPGHEVVHLLGDLLAVRAAGNTDDLSVGVSVFFTPVDRYFE